MKTIILHLSNGASITLPNQTEQHLEDIQSWIHTKERAIYTVHFSDCDMHILNTQVTCIVEKNGEDKEEEQE